MTILLLILLAPIVLLWTFFASIGIILGTVTIIDEYLYKKGVDDENKQD